MGLLSTDVDKGVEGAVDMTLIVAGGVVVLVATNFGGVVVSLSAGVDSVAVVVAIGGSRIGIFSTGMSGGGSAER